MMTSLHCYKLLVIFIGILVLTACGTISEPIRMYEGTKSEQEIVKFIYALYNSTTQINVYWYVRGKHFDFWQATTEQGKPGYFTTVYRNGSCPTYDILDGKPLL